MKYNIITRKIEIFVNENDKEQRTNYYKQLRDWSYISRNYANDIVNLLQSVRVLDNLNKKVSQNINESINKYLDCSKENVGYKVLTNHYKDILPSTFRASINRFVYSDFNKTIKSILIGEKTITNFKRDFPLYFNKQGVRNIYIDEIGGGFEFFSIPMRFNFGRDKSNNKAIIESILTNEYQMSDSSFKFYGNKLFLLLVIKIPENNVSLDKDKVLGVDLGINVPAYLAINNDKHFRMSIGDRDSLLTKRIGIQKQRKSLQRSLKLVNGGFGRNKKLKKLDSLGSKERNLVKNINNNISREIINVAVKNNCGIINIEDLSGIGKENKYILRNWSYFELQNMIQYKAKLYGITVNKIKSNYTSQCCNKCNHINVENRLSQSQFVCQNCGYEDNADFNGAKNISRAHTKEFKKIVGSINKKELV